MPAGAILLLDDYGFSAHEAQKIAFDAFAATTQEAVFAPEPDTGKTHYGIRRMEL